MTAFALIPNQPFAAAKSQLSELMSDVVHRHHPHVVNRHRGREAMLLMGLDDLRALLEPFEFDTRVAVSNGEFVVRLPELNLVAAAPDYDEALGELVELVEAYTAQYLERTDFYLQTDRRQHLPWLLRFAVTPEEMRRDLLAGAQRSSVGAAPQRA